MPETLKKFIDPDKKILVYDITQYFSRSGRAVADLSHEECQQFLCEVLDTMDTLTHKKVTNIKQSKRDQDWKKKYPFGMFVLQQVNNKFSLYLVPSRLGRSRGAQCHIKYDANEPILNDNLLEIDGYGYKESVVTNTIHSFTKFYYSSLKYSRNYGSYGPYFKREKIVASMEDLKAYAKKWGMPEELVTCFIREYFSFVARKLGGT